MVAKEGGEFSSQTQTQMQQDVSTFCFGSPSFKFTCPVQLLLILSLMTIDIIKKRPYRPYIIGLVGYVVLFVVIIYISVIDVGVIEAIWNTIWG